MKTGTSLRGITAIWTMAIVMAWALLPGALHAQFVYVANAAPNKVSGYRIDPNTGALTPVPGSPFIAGENPIFVEVHPSGRFVYVVNVVSNSVSGYAIDLTNGALTPISGSPFDTENQNQLNQPKSVVVDPSGKFAYVYNNGGVLGYPINPTNGALTPIPDSPFPAPGTSFGMDPSGKFAYVPTFPSGIEGYTINSTTGALALISGSPFPRGANGEGSAVVFDPSGKFVYVVNGTDDDVSAEAIDPATGALTEVPGSPFPAGLSPSSAAADPSGKFLYVTDEESNNVLGYTINPTSGALTAITGSPFPAGRVPSSVAIDPSGRFAYVTNVGASSISAYSINSNTGALTPISGSPFATAFTPISVAIAGCALRPDITGVSAMPATLWPPNHKLVEVLVDYSVTAPCGEPAVCTLSVANNEPVSNDDTSPDWAVLGEHLVELRAERSGKGTGRIYTITISCKDTRGNSATQNTEVTVAHDQGH
jgi:6-phosphogluconolactonase